MLPLPISAFGWRTPPTWVARTSGPAGRAPHQHGDPFRVSGHRCDLPWMSPLGRMLGPRRQLGTALRAACRPNRSEPSRVPAGVGSPILRIRSRPPKRGGRLPHSPTGCQARPWARPQGLGLGPVAGPRPGPAARRQRARQPHQGGAAWRFCLYTSAPSLRYGGVEFPQCPYGTCGNPTQHPATQGAVACGSSCDSATNSGHPGRCWQRSRPRVVHGTHPCGVVPWRPTPTKK